MTRRSPTARPPRAAVILGSGAWKMLRRGRGLRLSEGRPVETPFGPSRPVFEVVLPGGRRVLLLTRHGEKGYDVGAWAANYRANLWALKDRGADLVLGVSSSGGLDPRLDVGTFVVPHDVLDRTAGRAKTFFDRSGLGVIRHCDPFCPTGRAALAEALAALGMRHKVGGVYVCTDGPRLETPAEIRSFAAAGATLVGMTIAPEFALARELELCYAPLCWIVNPAEGVIGRPYRADTLFEGMATREELEAGDRAAEALPAILAAALERLGPDRECDCRKAMARYKARGDIGRDFRTWIES